MMLHICAIFFSRYIGIVLFWRVFFCVVGFFFPFGMLVHLSPLSFLRSWLGVGAAVVLPASY